ncbi:ubiquitin-related domain-containing protein [Xylogone sp. PMI_703]|nr:ubiquitin-related domain-containing protein [Xylogone sp. PMI_703]
MAASDLSVLLDMGFEKERAEMAVKQTGGLQGALQWLEDNQDKPLEELTASTTKDEETDPNVEPPALKEGEVAKSMVCEDCGKKFRSVAQAEFHASKTEHMNFSESTEEIAPLTEEEKKQRLQELRAALAEKRAKQALVDKEEQKKNEKIRMKATKEAQDIKEELQKKERIKEAEAKRKEKLDDIAAKKRIQEKIAADKEERRLKAAREKAEREGRAPPPDPSTVAAAAAAPSAPRPTAAHTEARLRLQTASGNIQKTFPVETTLFEVASALEGEGKGPVTSFSTTFPKKTFSGPIDFAKTLKEADLVPSAVLIVK